MLIYIGDGTGVMTQFGIAPTRDLTDEEVKLYGKRLLLNSGLYIKPAFSNKPTKSAVKTAEGTEEPQGVEP